MALDLEESRLTLNFLLTLYVTWVSSFLFFVCPLIPDLKNGLICVAQKRSKQ